MNKRIRKKRNQAWAERVHGKDGRNSGLQHFLGNESRWRTMPPEGPPPLPGGDGEPPALVGAEEGHQR